MKSIFAFIHSMFGKFLFFDSSVRIGSRVKGICTWVCDGDKVYVQISPFTRIKVRIAGEDAPEHGQKFCSESKRFLIQLLYRKKVIVQIVDRDRYGRYVGIVRCENNDAALEILKAGLAWCYYAYLKNLPRQYANAYKEAANEARRDRRGMWRTNNPIPPWDWRKDQKEKGEKKNWFTLALGFLLFIVIMVIILC